MMYGLINLMKDVLMTFGKFHFGGIDLWRIPILKVYYNKGGIP